MTLRPDDTDSRAIKPSSFSKPFIWLIGVIGFLCRVLLLAWATPGDLLLKSAMGLVTTAAGSSVPGIRYLGLMADVQTTNVSGLRGSVSLRACLVVLHSPFA